MSLQLRLLTQGEYRPKKKIEMETNFMHLTPLIINISTQDKVTSHHTQPSQYLHLYVNTLGHNIYNFISFLGVYFEIKETFWQLFFLQKCPQFVVETKQICHKIISYFLIFKFCQDVNPQQVTRTNLPPLYSTFCLFLLNPKPLYATQFGLGEHLDHNNK